MTILNVSLTAAPGLFVKKRIIIKHVFSDVPTDVLRRHSLRHTSCFNKTFIGLYFCQVSRRRLDGRT